MKRINLAEDVKITAYRPTQRSLRDRSMINGPQRAHRWVICIQRGGRQMLIPYARGPNLQGGSSIDTNAVFKTLMMEIAARHVSTTPEELMQIARTGAGEDDMRYATVAFERLGLLRDRLKDVLGDEFDRVLGIVLTNLEEMARAA